MAEPPSFGCFDLQCRAELYKCRGFETLVQNFHRVHVVGLEYFFFKVVLQYSFPTFNWRVYCIIGTSRHPFHVNFQFFNMNIILHLV